MGKFDSNNLVSSGGNAGKASGGGAKSSAASKVAAGASKFNNSNSSPFGSKATPTSNANPSQKKEIGLPVKRTYDLGNGKTGTVRDPWRKDVDIKFLGTYEDEQGRTRPAYTATRNSLGITDDYYKRLDGYLNSGATDIETTRRFRNEAVIQMNQAYDPNEKAWWENTLGYLDATVYNEYKGKIDRVTASLEGYNTNLTNATNEFRSTQGLLGYQTDSNSAEYKDLFGRNQTASSKMKTAQGQVDRANAMKTQLEDEMAGYFMDRDTFEARERLEKNNYVGTERDLNLYATDPSALTNERSKKEMDQARLDAYNRSLGIGEKFYNHEDKWKANTEATISDINSSIIGAFSDFNKLGYGFAKGVERESFAVNSPKEKAQPVSVEQAIREKAGVTSRIAILEKQEADIKRSAGTDSLHLNDEAYSSVAAIDKELRGLKKKLTEYNDIINASGDGPTSLGYTLKNFSEDDFFGFLDRAQDNLDAQTAAKLNKAMQDTGAVEKFGMNLSRTMAEVGFDWAVQYITGVPALASMYARVEGKASAEGRRELAAREARGEDVNTEILGINLSAQDKASIYGHASAGVEILTEKLTDGLGYIYGRGKATDIVEKAVGMLADTPDGMNFLRFIADSSGEGGEEVISDLIDPALKCIINGESLKHNYSELEASELLYDYFLGSVMGLTGAASGLVSGGPEGYAAKNVDIYQNKVDSDIQARQDILQKGQNRLNAVTPPEGSLAQQVIDATRGQGENSQTRQNRIVQMLQDPEQVKLFEQATGKEITGNTIADKWASVESILSGRTKGETIREETQTKLAEQEKKDSSITKAFQKYQHGEDLNRSEISMLYAAGVIDKSQRDAMRQLEKADRLIAKSAAKTNQRREFFIQQAQDNGVRTRAEKNNAPVFEGEARLANDEIEHNQAKPPESAVMAPQSAPASGGTDIATAPAESVKPTAEPLTRDESRKAVENHEADNKKLASVVPIVDAAVSAEKPVHQINGNLFAKTGQEGEPPLSKKVWNWLQQFFVKGEGPNIYSNKLKADVIINERGLKNDVSHHLGETKAATFEAIPYVIRNGMTVSKTTDSNGKVRSIIVAGKVYLNNKNGKNGVPVNVYCLLKADDAGQNRFYLHEVSDGKGNLYYQLNNAEKDASTALQDSTPQMQGSAEETSSVQSVPQTEVESKTLPAQQENSVAEIQEQSAPKAEIESKSQNAEMDKSQSNTTEEEADYLKKQHGQMAKSVEAKHITDSGKYYYYLSYKGHPYVYDGHTLWYFYTPGGGTEIKPVKAAEGVDALKYLDREFKYEVERRGSGIQSINDLERIVLEDEQELIKDTNTKFINPEHRYALPTSIDLSLFPPVNGSIIEAQERSEDNGNLRQSVEENSEVVGEVDGEREGRSSGVHRLPYQPDFFPGQPEAGESLYKEHERIVKAFESQGAKPVNRSDWTEEEKRAEKFLQKLGIKHLTILDSNGAETWFGASNRKWPGIGIFAVRRTNADGSLDIATFRRTLIHEALHNKISQLELSQGYAANHSEVLQKINEKAGFKDKDYRKVLTLFLRGYAEHHLGAPADFLEWSSSKQTKWMQNQPAEKLGAFSRICQEELLCNMIAGQRSDRFENVDYNKLTAATREVLGDLFPALKGADFDSFINDGESISSLDMDVGRTSDTIKESQNRVDVKPSGTVTEHNEGELKKKTQVKGAKAEHEERMADIAKKFGTDDGTFLSYTREEVSRIANYCIEKYGMQEEWNRLMGEKNWSRVDFSEAGKIVYEMTIQLNRDMTNGSSGLGPILERKPGESNKEYFERQKQSDKDAYLARREPIDAMLQMYAQQKSEAGQKLQEQHKFTIADEIRMRASQRFLSYTEDGEVNNASDLAKNAKMWNIIDDLLTRAEKADTSGSKDAMMDVTKLVSRIRGRETMWGRLGMKEESRMLKDLYNGGFDSDAMASLMYGGISKIIDDLTPMTYADVIQTVRMNNMLSSPATALNNFLNNANALRVGSIAQNAAYPFAKVFEALTGKKVAFTDTSFTRIGKGKMRAEKMAMEYALLSAYYGMDGERGRFDPKDSNAGFWLNGSGASGVAGRALARYNFLINAMVLSPDAPAKARANLGMKEGIERAFAGEEMTPEKARNKKELEAFADVETKRRVLQDDNGATRAVLWAKNQINKAHTPGGKTVVKGRQLGELRLGDFAIAFAKVPANVGLQKVMATPYGAAFQMGRYAAGLIEAAHNPEGMDTIKMAKLSRDIGRAFTTWGMIGLGALGAMTGALKNFDDTDDDEEKKLAAEKGYNGLTFNVSALLRRGSEWKDGDLVVSGNFLEILALPLTIGAFMYDAQQEGMGTFEAINYGTKESFTHLVDAVMEIPGLQQVGQLWESYAANKNTGASDYERAMKSLGQFVANSSTSYLIPNLVAQTAAGLDNKQRDIYNTTAYGESLKNIWMAKIPGLREKLPEKTDTFGNTRTYGDNSIMAMVNTVLLPGDIKKYHVSELEKELLRLKKETGYNGTLFDTKAQRKIETGNGEVEYTLNPDQQRAFHMAKAKYLVEAFDKFRTSDEYKTLTDDQRLNVLKMLRMDAERMVKNECLEEAGVEDRIRIDKWEETLTNWDDKIQYLSAKQLASSLWDDENNAVADFEGMDKFMQGDYKNLTPEMKELITNSLGYLDDIEAASKYKLTSEQWQTGHDIYRYYVDKIDASKTDDEKVTLAQESQMWADIQKATGATDHQMEYFEGDMKLWFQNTPNADQYYEYLKDAGMTRQEAANTIKTISDLKPQPGYEESDYIQASQRYIAICDTVPKDKQWAAFWTIVPSNAAKKKVAMMHDLQAQGVSLRTALSASGMGEIRGRTEIAPGKWKYYTISK